MNNMALHQNSDGPRLEYGRVLGAERQRFAVHSEAGSFTAKRAFGCLVAPEPGDFVLISIGGDEHAYILQVLERKRGDHARIETAGNLDLCAAGRVTIQGQGLDLDAGVEEMRLASAREVALVSPGKTVVATHEFNLHASEGQVYVGKLAFIGQHLMSQWEKVKSTAKTIDTAVERVVARLGSSYRYVRELDETNAGIQRTLVDGTHAVHAKNSIHTAEETVKVDSEQIHLG